MSKTEHLEMESGQSAQENTYANMSHLNAQRMKTKPKDNVTPAASSTWSRVILTLGVLLTLAVIIMAILISFLFISYKSLSEEQSHLKNKLENNGTGSLSSDIQGIRGAVQKLEEDVQKANNADLISKVAEITSSSKNVLTDKVSAFFSNNIQRILGVLGTLTEEVQKTKDSAAPLCSAGWTHYGLSCYYLSSDSQPWNVSKKDCEDRAAHLVVVNGEGEMDFLGRIKKDIYVWIGLTDEDGSWKWVDGTPYDVTPKFWGSGQPDDWKNHGLGGGEDCAEMRTDNKWNDAPCSSNHQYVCEKKIS